MLFKILLVLFIVIIVISIVIFVHVEYIDFVKEHSLLLKKVIDINKKYCFNDIEEFHLIHYYDNELSYDKINERDYLVYELVFEKNEVKNAMSNVLENQNIYDFYKDEITSIKIFGEFDTEVTLKNADKLLRIEKKLFNKLVKKPTIIFEIEVTLYLTNIEGRVLDEKSKTFDAIEIEDILVRLEDKTNDFYHDKEIWDSICLVERGKVSNRMRFAIYDRDNHRCKKCGRRTDNLEIDHIIPISKGGKSTYDNLQTLCHWCNIEKSNKIEPSYELTMKSKYGICPQCGAPLRLINGKYGQFYGCMNYPNCKYTKM